MNEQINELFEQAAKEFSAEHKYATFIVPNPLKEKFAELIVQECANHCDLLLDHKISSEWSRGTHDCSRAIKKHFGVEK